MTTRPQSGVGRRAAFSASLEFGTHALLGQHLYRRTVASTIPKCMRCGQQAVLTGGLCGTCQRIEEREEAGRG